MKKTLFWLVLSAIWISSFWWWPTEKSESHYPPPDCGIFKVWDWQRMECVEPYRNPYITLAAIAVLIFLVALSAWHKGKHGTWL